MIVVSREKWVMFNESDPTEHGAKAKLHPPTPTPFLLNAYKYTI
jgi:hypothetical protein